jgi:hypothetical protein
VPQTSTKLPENDYINSPLRALMAALENHSDFATQIAELLYNIFKKPGRLTLPHMYIYLKEACADDIFLCYDSLCQLLPCWKKIN